MDSETPKNSRYTPKGISRRTFLGNSAALVGGAFLSPLAGRAHPLSANRDTIKIALVGCGARGTGAVVNAMRADENIELVAMADIFRDMIDRSYEQLVSNDAIKDRINVPGENKFVGLEAYREAIDLADVVLLVTPPAFRPLHFETAINAGKHVFMEKPLSSDAPGARRILETGKVAEEKGLCVVVGLQNRYAVRYQQVKEKVANGDIGEITSMSCNYLIGGITQIDRQPGQTEMEYQLRNWRHFEWLWAGSPAGLTIHVEDIAHWLKGSFPVQAFGTGGRQGISGPEHGDIYDHFYIDYQYEDGTSLHSRTRHIQGCWLDRSLHIEGTEGRIELPVSGEIVMSNRKGEEIWSYRDIDDPNPYQTEHEVLFQAIRSGDYVNDTEWAGRSNMTSILGRMAVKSGHRLDWDEALNSDLVLVPDHLTFDSQPPNVPDETGNYPVITPGSKRGVL